MTFYFPGYAEGGLSGDTAGTASAVNLYVRMPMLPTVNTVYQEVPRSASRGHSRWAYVGLLHRFQDHRRTVPQVSVPCSRLLARQDVLQIRWFPHGHHVRDEPLCQHVPFIELEFVVNQSIWFEGEAKFADVILPACTNFERSDISEFANCGGYIQHSFNQCNHRVVLMQHKCIEPLGESKSDFQIFLDLAKRLGFSAMFSEGSRNSIGASAFLMRPICRRRSPGRSS